MLVEFRVENHRSIGEEQAISFEAATLGDGADRTVREVGSYKLLPAIALYGANASGKSNVLSAFGFMREAVLWSHNRWEPEGVPRNPFAWGRWRQEPTMMEATFLIDGVRYEYGFVADDRAFLEEWLFAWPKGRKQVWFERDGTSFKFGENLRGENKLVEGVTRDNALFLSAAVQHRNEQLEPLFDWFQGTPERRPASVGDRILFPSSRKRDRMLSRIYAVQGDWFRSALLDSTPTADADPRMHQFRELLSAADVGILDFRYSKGFDPETGRVNLEIRHQSSETHAWLPVHQESEGTLALFEIGPQVIDALYSGTLLLVDELEASLHPLLARRIVQMFNDSDINRRHAQLLFTTHDTNLLGNLSGGPSLRRDQVWLTEKSNEGATCAYPLTDYKPRNNENLERGYLQGRYGAIPYLGRLAAPPEPEA